MTLARKDGVCVRVGFGNVVEMNSLKKVDWGLSRGDVCDCKHEPAAMGCFNVFVLQAMMHDA